MDSITISTTIPEQPTLQVTAESELMKNYLGALPASPEQELYAVHDSKSRPIVFSFSPEGRLFAIHHQDQSATGWMQVDLTPGLPSHGVPVTAAVGQLPGGNVFVAVGLRDREDPSKSTVAIAGPLSPDLTQTDFSALGSLWFSLPVQAAPSVERIVIGPVDDGQGLGVPTVAVSLKNQDANHITTFLVRAQLAPDGSSLQWQWVDFPTPTVKAAWKDFALGAIADLGAGVYMLYEGEGPSGDEPSDGGGATWLVFKTFLDERGRSFDRQLLAPEGACCLATAPPKDGTTGLFVAGVNGVSWFAPDNQAKRASAVSIPGALPAAIAPGGLIVRGDPLHPGTTSVWALAGEELLHFNDAGGAGTWSPPVSFRSGIARIAPLANDTRYANELICMGTDIEQTRSLTYMWQDPTTTLWKSDKIPLGSTDHLYEFNCYTTHLSFDDGAARLAGRTVRISAGARVRVVINGMAHIVDGSTEVEALTDLQGNVTVIQQVADLAAPLLHVRADFFDGVIDVDPAHNVTDRLRKVNGPNDVPLPNELPDGVTGSDVANAVQALAKLHPDSASASAPALRYRAPGAPPAPMPALRTDHLPAGGGFSLSFAGAGFRIHPQIASFGSFGGWFGDAVGDAIEFLTSAAKHVSHFVVKVENDMVSFAAYLGDTAVQFVVKTAEDVFKLVTWVFHKIEVGFEELVQWLGYLFEWKDIWHTHKMIAAMARNGLDYVASRADAEIAQWEGRVDAFFEHLASASRAVTLPPDLAATQVKSSAPAGVGGGLVKALNSPIGNWSFYQLQHGGLAGAGAPSLAVVDTAGHESLLESILSGFVQAVRDLQDAIRLFADAWREGGATFVDVAKLAEAPLMAALEPMRPLVKAAFGLIRSALHKIRESLDHALPVPFIGTLYKWLTALLGDEEELTCINAVALLVAIPATVISKMAGHGAPFSGERARLGDADVFDYLFGHRAGPTAALSAAAPRAHFASRALGDAEEDPVYRGYLLIGGLIASCVGFFPPILRGVGTLLTATEPSSSSSSTTSNAPQPATVPTTGNTTNTGWTSRLASWFAGGGWRKIARNVLLAFSFVCDVIQLATTIPLPQPDLPKDSPAYGLRVAAAGFRYLVALPISYTLQITAQFVDRPWFDYVSGSITIVSDLVGGALVLTADILKRPDLKQWLADLFSNFGGLAQGVGEILAVSTKNAQGPISKAVLATLTGIFGVGGLGLAEAGTGLYIDLAVESGTSGGVSFTNPGG